MKRIILCMAVGSMLLNINCSKPAENNDPVIGIWSSQTDSFFSVSKKQPMKQEWIFNDAYLGRFHSYRNQQLEFKTDFKWSLKDGIYTISYPGTDLNPNFVSIEISSSEETILQNTKGNILAIRE